MTSFLLIWIHVFLHIEEAKNDAGLTEQTIVLWLQGLFVFSLIWSMGSVLTQSSRLKFDEMLRELMIDTEKVERPKSVKLTKTNSVPDRLTVFDFMFERKATGAWVEWSAKLFIPERGKDEKPENMIVPTVETQRMSYFLDLYIGHRIPMLLVGHTGRHCITAVANR